MAAWGIAVFLKAGTGSAPDRTLIVDSKDVGSTGEFDARYPWQPFLVRLGRLQVEHGDLPGSGLALSGLDSHGDTESQRI